MICLFHADNDGRCSAFWVAKRFNDFNPEHYFEMDYGKEVDWFSHVKKDEKVIIVDFSISPDEMRKLLEVTKNIIWLDHHVSAIEKYKDFEHDIPGLRYNGIAGCMLTYCYFFEMNDGREQFNPETMCIKAPWFTKYIADYDVWKYEYGEETTHFILGLDCIEDTSPMAPIWESLDDISKVRELISNGIICEKYRKSLAERAVNNSGFEFDIQGIKTFCMNNNDSFSNSCWFNNKVNEYDMICAFSYTGKCWTYSLYCSDYAANKKGINCAKIAQKMNPAGGGHVKSAGFQTDKCIFG